MNMKIIKVNLLQDYSEAIREAVVVLKAGGTIVYPTDTIYGIGCNACDFKAVETVYRIKERSLTKPLSVIARNVAWIKELALVPTKLEPILEQLWPGAITVILAKKSVIPSIVTAGHPNVGLRIPDYEMTEKLLAKFGYPLISTSANIADEGDQDANDPEKIIATFKDRYLGSVASFYDYRFFRRCSKSAPYRSHKASSARNGNGNKIFIKKSWP